MKIHLLKTGIILSTILAFTAIGDAQTNEPAAEVAVVVAAEEGVPGGIIVSTLALQAKVVAIDLKTRELGLLMPGGTITVIEAGPEVINFNQIEKGDMVKAKVTEEIVIQMGAADSELDDGEEVDVVLAPEGAKPGGIVADTVRMTATVVAIDGEIRTVLLRFEDGTHKMVEVRDDIDLTKHRIGEKVVFEITEMIAISVEKQ